jgi:hypothetical protein
MSLITITALFTLAMGLAGFAWTCRAIVRARASEQWPRTAATIEQSSVSSRVGSESTKLHEAKVTYRYSVDGREFTGSEIHIGPQWSWSSSEPAKSLVQQYPRGAAVTIAYDPAKPEDAVLEPGVTAGAWGGLAFFLLLAGFSAAVAGGLF